MIEKSDSPIFGTSPINLKNQKNNANNPMFIDDTNG